MVGQRSNLVADPMPEIKSLALAAMRWPAQILFPPVCAGCRRHVSQPGALCAACWPGLKFLERPWCAVMGTPFSQDMGEGFLSGGHRQSAAIRAGAFGGRLFRRGAANGAGPEIP
jgi:hypothetical protein